MAHHSSLDPGMLDLTPDIRQELQRLSEQRDLMMQKAQGYESSLEAERQAGGCWKSQALKRTVEVHDSKRKGPMIAGRSLRKES